jgi:hypothetical protein
MTRYFFNMRSRDKYIPDDEGEDYVNLVAAKEGAVIAAREILAELVKNGGVIDASKFEITDDSGTLCATIPFREVLRFSTE